MEYNSEDKEKKITKDMIIADIIRTDPNMAGVLMASGMGCITCPASLGESLEEAAYVHGIDADVLEVRLNAFLDAMEEQRAQQQGIQA